MDQLRSPQSRKETCSLQPDLVVFVPMIRIAVVCFLFVLTNLSSFDFCDFDSYQFKISAEEVEQKIKTYLEKDSAIQNYYRLTPEALYLGDYVLHLRDGGTSLKKRAAAYGLKGVKVALDPGHFGGAFADLEQRVVRGPGIYFCEGDLTYLTAMELKRLLEAEGAIVMITRSSIGSGALEVDFDAWKECHPDLVKSADSMSALFRSHYNKEDLLRRAEKINAFGPDIAIMIHYNMHLTEIEKLEKKVLTRSNYNMAFIPGAFCADELQTARDQYEFLRLIVSDAVEESLLLSEAVTAQFVQQLQVPLIDERNESESLRRVTLLQKSGIYSRNLALTRLVHCPLCYGETLIQNNEEEIYRLSLKDTEIERIPCSKRIKEVARAYFEGIKAYFS